MRLESLDGGLGLGEILDDPVVKCDTNVKLLNYM